LHCTPYLPPTSSERGLSKISLLSSLLSQRGKKERRKQQLFTVANMDSLKVGPAMGPSEGGKKGAKGKP